MRPAPGVACACLALLVAGCHGAAPPVPAGYQGGVATLKDTVEVAPNADCGSFFVLTQYDGQPARNAYIESSAANTGVGAHWAHLREYARAVPARAGSFTLAGGTHCAATLMEYSAWTHAHLVEGTVAFTPQAGAVYVVRGALTEEASAVWIAEEASGRQVSARLLVHGSARPRPLGGTTGKVESVPAP